MKASFFETAQSIAVSKSILYKQLPEVRCEMSWNKPHNYGFEFTFLLATLAASILAACCLATRVECPECLFCKTLYVTDLSALAYSLPFLCHSEAMLLYPAP